MLRFLVLALILVPLAPSVATAESCPAPAGESSLVYAAPGSRPHWGAQVMGFGFEENVFIWPSGASADLWLESNGLEGLQTSVSPCGPADTLLAGASAGVGRPRVIV